MSDLQSQIKSNIEVISHITDLKSLEENKRTFLGKTGIISEELKKLGSFSPEDRKKRGKEINELKELLLKAYNERQKCLVQEEVNKQLNSEKLDLSLPPRGAISGYIHPLTRVKREVLEIFGSMGFGFKEGPDIETDYYNFTALNIPENHPARDMHDTFYVESKGGMNVLRTHTSNVQIREMEKNQPPFKFISMGRVFRCDYDATHTPMFHQVEGLYIGENITMAHLKGCLQEFLNAFFVGKEVSIRMRPSYFPFTEPSAEVDISIGKNSEDWLEILGCGMVHPNVLKHVGVDPNQYQGFAFGMGVERIAMLKYGMKDLRPFFDGDVRWLKKYGFQYFTTPSLIKGGL